jgi:protein SCO1/2
VPSSQGGAAEPNPMSRSRPALIAAAAALVLAAAVVLAISAGPATRGPLSSPINTSAGPGSQTGFAGAALPADVQAPGFVLRDQHGRRVALSAYRGQVAILTFLAATPSGASPLVAQQIRGALDDLAKPVPAIAISADPAGDTPERVRRFLAQAALSGRMEYLGGTPAQLRPIWRAYRALPLSAGSARFDSAAMVLLIDAHGRERVLFGVEELTPEGLAHDVRRLQAER